MDLPPPVQKSSHDVINKTLLRASCDVQDQSMSAAGMTEFTLGVQEEDQIVVDILCL